MLGGLPHEGFADLQFFRTIAPAPPLDLQPLHLADADPVIRVMHSYAVGRPLGYLVERAIGEGRLIVCSLELDQQWPEARYMLSQLCAYAIGEDLPPAEELSSEALAALVVGTALE